MRVCVCACAGVCLGLTHRIINRAGGRKSLCVRHGERDRERGREGGGETKVLSMS